MFSRVINAVSQEQDPHYSKTGCVYSYYVQSNGNSDLYVLLEDPTYTYHRSIDSFAISDWEIEINPNWKNLPILGVIINPEDPEACEKGEGAFFRNLSEANNSWKDGEFLPTMESIEGMVKEGATEGEIGEGSEQYEGSGLFHGSFSFLPGDFSVFGNILGFPDWLWLVFIAWLFTRKKTKKKEYHYYYG